MQLPVQISFRNMEPDEAIEKIVRRKAAGLEKYSPRMMGCRVVIEAPHRRHRSGNLYHIRVEATVPGKELVVKRDPRLRTSHADLLVAIRDAFNAARRELMDESRRRRGQVKAHDGMAYGVVARLDRDKEYGFLTDEEGREIYFHANSVIDGFDRLRRGASVRFTEEPGDKGPQASTVALAGKRRRRPLRPHV